MASPFPKSCYYLLNDFETESLRPLHKLATIGSHVFSGDLARLLKMSVSYTECVSSKSVEREVMAGFASDKSRFFQFMVLCLAVIANYSNMGVPVMPPPTKLNNYQKCLPSLLQDTPFSKFCMAMVYAWLCAPQIKNSKTA